MVWRIVPVTGPALPRRPPACPTRAAVCMWLPSVRRFRRACCGADTAGSIRMSYRKAWWRPATQQGGSAFLRPLGEYVESGLLGGQPRPYSHKRRSYNACVHIVHLCSCLAAHAWRQAQPASAHRCTRKMSMCCILCIHNALAECVAPSKPNAMGMW